MEPPFQQTRQLGQWIADDKVESRDCEKNAERLERRVVDELPGAGEFDEADDRGDRRVLDHLHGKADGGRQRDAQGLRQDDVAVLLGSRHAPRILDASHCCLGTA